MSKYTVADTKTFLKLAEAAEISDYLKVKRTIDPDGTHVVYMSMLHNDFDVRASWFVKMAGSDEPTTITFDVPLAAFNKLATIEAPVMM